MTAKTIAATYSHKKLFWYLTYTLIALVLVYIYCINVIVMGVVQRENLRTKFGALKTSVTNLESQYVAVSGTITLDLAHNLGYKDAADKASFAYSSNPGVTLSYRRTQ
jgi:hypothetical protein